MDTFTNVAGCDSIVTLDLTINTSSSSTDVQTACNTFTWTNGMTYTSSTNTAMDTFTNVAGCDSIVTLDLTINTVDTSTTVSTNTVQSNALGAAYQWLDCDNSFAIISGETDSLYMPTVNGNYAVQVTSNGCVDTSSCVSVTVVGVNNINSISTISVFPNPNKGVVNVDLGKISNAALRVYTIAGQVVFEKQNIQQSLFQFELDVPSGVYLIEVNASELLNGKTLHKLIIE
jgi:hypothetical protein